MIIDKKLKYIFIGLPFSGSTSISKELILTYGGTATYHKHANIPILLKNDETININDYLVVAVIRDPIDITYSMYNKFINNTKNVYTNKKYFIEHGGYVSKHARKIYQTIIKENLDYESYLKKVYRFKPYNNDLSINNEYINFTLNFDNLSQDFRLFIENIGLSFEGELPNINKTKKPRQTPILSSELANRIFGPFYRYNKKFFNGINQFSCKRYNYEYFRLLNKIRTIKRISYDQLRANTTDSYNYIYDNKDKKN